MNILGFKEPYNEIRFGPFTGNATLIKWFAKLNEKFGVNGSASIFYKPVGKNKTFGMTGALANKSLETLLHSKSTAFIYHCYNHYCCPVGYEHESADCTQIYGDSSNAEYINWVLIADTSRKYPCFHCVKWEDIDKDLNTKSPEFLNIRHLERGVQVRETKQQKSSEISDTSSRAGAGNLHCIIKFESVASSSSELNGNPSDMQLLSTSRKDQDGLYTTDSDESEQNEDLGED